MGPIVFFAGFLSSAVSAGMLQEGLLWGGAPKVFSQYRGIPALFSSDLNPNDLILQYSTHDSVAIENYQLSCEQGVCDSTGEFCQNKCVRENGVVGNEVERFDEDSHPGGEVIRPNEFLRLKNREFFVQIYDHDVRVIELSESSEMEDFLPDGQPPSAS
ncbi:hypothetical protein [Endozoicomonas numazuensis]|uniref:Uncharacterized protein n=1 Tax=Endozoicomonas numazuensis TaxID=1137799 RepID=A0A081NEQ8_9GAMM|nr:hypothetical protein [Endozoicomonas numazuensis]KEQ16931.1 hypothetical protein GZ78_20055 [Endozoicomonas numazuensis]